MIRRLLLGFGAVLLLSFDGWGCVQWPTKPPENFSIGDGFSDEERETIRAAVAAWCDATGDCASEALWSERGRFELVDDIEEDGDCPEQFPDCVVAGRNNSKVIRIARNRKQAEDLSVLWLVAAHEWGHFCMLHTESGLMSAALGTTSRTDVDDVAVQAWKDGCE